MKDYTAYGIVVNEKLVAVYLESYFAEQQVGYFKHLGKAVIVELKVNTGSILDLMRKVENSQRDTNNH